MSSRRQHGEAPDGAAGGEQPPINQERGTAPAAQPRPAGKCSADEIDHAQQRLDRHLRELIAWHFSEETGCPYWLDWARAAGWDPRDEVRTVADLNRFPLFDDDVLRDLPNEAWIPKAFAGRPFFVFETGGTTGMPKQRLSWTDHLHDYTEFSGTLDDAAFPPGAHWLMAGPTGPRRLRLAIEHLAQLRGGSCYFVDLDPRWVKRCLAAGDFAQAEAYKQHVVDQAITILRHRRNIRCLFTTPKILEAMAERTSLPGLGIRGVFCGGTSMTPQTVRFLAEESLEGVARFVPTYGNTLMGLACSLPLTATNGWSVIYHAPQPRAVLRVVDPADPARTVEPGAWGRIELTTLTREFFMPRLLERDEARRTPPSALYPWDGVADVRPFGAQSGKIIEGVY